MAKDNEGIADCWGALIHRQSVDVCVGVLLSRAVVCDPASDGKQLAGFTDPMSTLAAGSFGWWCRWLLDVIDNDYPIGDRLADEKIGVFMTMRGKSWASGSPRCATSWPECFPRCSVHSCDERTSS